MSDSKLIMKLRKATGVGMMECKKALEEANDDFEKAIDILRASGSAKAAKKADRQTNEGLVRFVVKNDFSKGVIVCVLCETDFVAKNTDFINTVNDIAKKSLETDAKEVFDLAKDELVLKMGENIQFGGSAKFEGGYIVGYIHNTNKTGALVQFSKQIEEKTANDIALHIVASCPMYLSRQDVPAEDIQREINVYKEQLKNENKPDNIINKIIDGKMNKFYQENCLLEQVFIKDEEKKVLDLLGDVKIDAYKLFSI